MSARRQPEDGFTLIELMVVVLVIAILIAICIPMFIGARARADYRAAQASLRDALTAAKAMNADTGTYASADSAGLPTVEPALTFVAGSTASTGSKVVSVRAGALSWSAAVKSDSGKCFWIRDAVDNSPTQGTHYGSGTPCTGDAADGAADSGFPSS